MVIQVDTSSARGIFRCMFVCMVMCICASLLEAGTITLAHSARPPVHHQSIRATHNSRVFCFVLGAGTHLYLASGPSTRVESVAAMALAVPEVSALVD